MIHEAMTPGQTPAGLLLNLVTFIVGFTYSLSQIPTTVMAKITLMGSYEVFYYGALGGIASLIAKYAADYCVKCLKSWIDRA